MDLVALSDFNLVARHGGVGRAARATGRPKATLSRRITDLEAQLGVRLFERGARLLTLTEEGRAMFARTSALLTELDETAKEIASGAQTPRGHLRISAPLLFSQTSMGKLAAGFIAKNPAVHLQVTTEDREVDMVEEAYDLVIRVNPKPDESLVGRIFLHDRLVVVANPALARPRTGDAVPAIVRGPMAGAETWDVITPDGLSQIAARPILSLSSFFMVRDAVRAGVGAAPLPLSFVSSEIAAGTLVAWGEVQGHRTSLWALYPTRRLLNPRVSAFLEHLKAAFPEGSPEELAGYMER